MRYLHRLKKKRLSEASFWLVSDANFINVVKLLGNLIVVDLYCFLRVEVLEYQWDGKVVVTDLETGEVLENMNLSPKSKVGHESKSSDTEIGQKHVYARGF